VSTDPNIWFIVGLSGAGKTYFANYLSKKRRWLHLDIDRLCIIGSNAYGDGLDNYKLKKVWSDFIVDKVTAPLVGAITDQYRSAQKDGAVLSFPSNYVIGMEHIKRIEKDIRVIYLFSSRENCLKAFLNREKTKSMVPPGKDKNAHWNEYNADMLYHLSVLCPASCKVDTFYETGVRKTAERIYTEITGCSSTISGDRSWRV
jgi:hypothetical protein